MLCVVDSSHSANVVEKALHIFTACCLNIVSIRVLYAHDYLMSGTNIVDGVGMASFRLTEQEKEASGWYATDMYMFTTFVVVLSVMHFCVHVVCHFQTSIKTGSKLHAEDF